MWQIVGISVKAAIFSRYFVNTYPSSVQAAFKGAIDSSVWLICHIKEHPTEVQLELALQSSALTLVEGAAM